jgi:hypothetical protein
MNEPHDPRARELTGSIRQTGESLRRLSLWCGLLAARLGDETSDTVVREVPERLVRYQLHEVNSN